MVVRQSAPVLRQYRRQLHGSIFIYTYSIHSRKVLARLVVVSYFYQVTHLLVLPTINVLMCDDIRRGTKNQTFSRPTGFDLSGYKEDRTVR